MKSVAAENLSIYQRYRRGAGPAAARRARAMRQLVSAQTGRVLELAALDSVLLDEFHELECFATDIIRRSSLPDIPFAVADLEKGIPFLDNRFDVVIAGEIIEHMLDTETLIAESWRVLKPQGELVLSTPNMAYWRNVLQVVKSENPFWVDWKSGQEGHVRYFSPQTMHSLLQGQGFHDVRIRTVQDVTSGRLSLRILGKLMEKCFPMHNMIILAKAVKPCMTSRQC